MTDLQALHTELQELRALISSLPPAVDGWSTQDIADAYQWGVGYVRTDVVNQPWFPKPISRGRGRRWFPEEVKKQIRLNRGRLS